MPPHVQQVPTPIRQASRERNRKARPKSHNAASSGADGDRRITMNPHAKEFHPGVMWVPGLGPPFAAPVQVPLEPQVQAHISSASTWAPPSSLPYGFIPPEDRHLPKARVGQNRVAVPAPQSGGSRMGSSSSAFTSAPRTPLPYGFIHPEDRHLLRARVDEDRLPDLDPRGGSRQGGSSSAFTVAPRPPLPYGFIHPEDRHLLRARRGEAHVADATSQSGGKREEGSSSAIQHAPRTQLSHGQVHSDDRDHLAESDTEGHVADRVPQGGGVRNGCWIGVCFILVAFWNRMHGVPGTTVAERGGHSGQL